MDDRTARVGVAGVAVAVCLKFSFSKTAGLYAAQLQRLKILFEYPN
jgi:hypothetical protein